jgi:succinate dehydrogenase hydrophobic anchor subunit
MEPVVILAILVAVYLIIARGIALIDPAIEKRIWRDFVKRPDYNVERMGFIFIALAAAMIYFALPYVQNVSALVILIAAGWLLCMGALATQKQPVKLMSKYFAKKPNHWVRITSSVFFVLGFLILYLVLG